MNRERLTITLRSDLLKTLDSTIDGERLRNRSHAIEYYLSRTLGLKAVKVLILAGGQPVYFESEKKSLPKAMVKIAGKPLLEQTLQRLKAAKLNEVYISIGEGGETVEDYFGDGSSMGISITYLQQQQSRGEEPLRHPARAADGLSLLPLLEGRDPLHDVLDRAALPREEVLPARLLGQALEVVLVEARQGGGVGLVVDQVLAGPAV